MEPNEKTDQKSFTTKRQHGKANRKSGRPRRPLTCYNIFFTYERAVLLGEDIDPRSIIEGMYSKSKRPRRVHRKSHGKISFKDLADHVSSAWRNLNAEKKDIFHKLADEALQMYRKAVEEYEGTVQYKALGVAVEAGVQASQMVDRQPSPHREKQERIRGSLQKLPASLLDDETCAVDHATDRPQRRSGNLKAKERADQFLECGLSDRSSCAWPLTKDVAAKKLVPDMNVQKASSTNESERSHQKRLDYLVNMWGSIDPFPPGPNTLDVDFLLS